MKRGLGWPIAVIAILGATVGANIWVAVIASDDPSFAVEHDYYKKAVQWDSTMAQARENARLGWRIEPRLEPIGGHGSTLSVTLTDESGAPIRDAKIDVRAFLQCPRRQRVARGAARSRIELRRAAADPPRRRVGASLRRPSRTRALHQHGAHRRRRSSAGGGGQDVTLLLGVLAASMLGSVHCAAMCGAFTCLYAGHGT